MMESAKYLIAIISALLTPPAWGKHPPELEWTTHRTVHFRIHHSPSYELFSRLLGKHLETAYEQLSSDLGWELSSPLDVVVEGELDIANGVATVYPLNRLVIHATPFLPGTFLGEYDDWIQLLATHELTHILANDATSGIFDTFRGIFGSVVKVNLYQPEWLIEGLAVYEETLHSHAGRGRSALVDMFLRTAARDGLLDRPAELAGFTLDRLNDGPPIWPRGDTPYIFGYLLYEMAVEQAGKGAPGLISKTSSGHLPYLPDWVAKKVLGTDYADLWSRVVKRLQERLLEDLELIRSAGPTPIDLIAEGGRMSGGLAVEPDGSKAYFMRDSYESGYELVAVEIGEKKKPRALTQLSIRSRSALKLALKGERTRWIIYSKLERPETFRLYSDAFAFDLDSGTEIRLTSGARAFDPDVSEGFQIEGGSISAGAIVMVKSLEDANQALVLWDGISERTLFRGEAFARLSGTAWGRGKFSDWVIISVKESGQNSRLLAVHVTNGRQAWLTTKGNLIEEDIMPAWGTDGSIWYTSSRGGVYNLRKLSPKVVQSALEGKAGPGIPITNLETGALFPAPLPGGKSAIAMVYGSKGFDVARVTVAPSKSIELAILRDKIAPKAIQLNPEKSSDSAEAHEAVSETDSYSVFPSIWPKYWFPFGTVVIEGLQLGALTSGTDALQLHSYQFLLGWDSRASFPIYYLSYEYDGFFPTLRFSRRQDNRYLSVYNLSNQYRLTDFMTIFPWGSWSLALGPIVYYTQYGPTEATHWGARAIGRHASFKVKPNSIDPLGENGASIEGALTQYLIGDETFAALELFGEWRIPLPTDRAFLRILASAGRSTNASLTSSYFIGGGDTTVGGSSRYLVRGYPAGTLLGRSIASASLEAWFPIADWYRGHGSWGAFHRRTKFRIFADTGSAEYVAGIKGGLDRWPIGAGIEALHDLKLGYHFPVTAAIGLHRGVYADWGAEWQLALGLYVSPQVGD